VSLKSFQGGILGSFLISFEVSHAWASLVSISPDLGLSTLY
jgi:hypothetical protein